MPELPRSEEHTSELQSHSNISYAVFCLKKKINLRDSYVTCKPAPRQGNRTASAYPANIFICRTGGSNDYVFFHCATVQMWKSLVTMCGRPKLCDDPRYADRRAR